jgi:macrolide transport system ATP-binding/permease protein
MGDGAIQLALGLICGVPLALGLSHALRTVLFGVGGQDPLVYTASVGLVIVSTLAAALLPALVASKRDPLIAVRQD